MATEATFTVPSNEFSLGTVFHQLPNVTVKLDRLIPSQDVVIPYFWVRGSKVESIESAFNESPGVKAIRLVDSVEDEYLLRVEWALEHDDVLTILAETEVPLIKSTGTDKQWTFEVRGDDRTDIADFQRRCRDVDIPLTLTKLHALTPIETGTEAALTDTQQEALTLAHERGYFESPREVTTGNSWQATRHLTAGLWLPHPRGTQARSRSDDSYLDSPSLTGHLTESCV